MVRAEVQVVTVLVSPVRVVRVELGVQVGLEDVGDRESRGRGGY